MITPLIGGAFILTNTHSDASEAATVKIPYLVIAAIFAAVAAMIYWTPLPEIHAGENRRVSVSRILEQGHLIRGVIAQFFYVGAQVGVASFVIRFAEFTSPGMPDKVAANSLKLHLLLFMFGRFAGSAAMKYISAARLLAVFALGALASIACALIGSGAVAIGGVVAAGFFHSIMFPTIFALSIKGLGPLTKTGSSLLVMAIVGGAVFPALMGYLSDGIGIQRAFVVPLGCYAYIFYYAASGYRIHTAKEQECHASA
jgi:FHS family L-fucose permease-like MFS transporter